MTWSAIFGTDPGPYVLLVLAGMLPTAVWRVAGVLIGQSLDPRSPLLDWVRLVSIAMLAGVVAKLLGTPGGALALVPAWARYGGILAGLVAFMLARRSLLAGVLTGEAVVILGAWWTAGGHG